MDQNQTDPHRAQILRQQCNRILKGKSIHDVVGAVEMMTADIVTLGLPGLAESEALSMAESIAGDIRNIIHERFAAKSKGH